MNLKNIFLVSEFSTSNSRSSWNLKKSRWLWLEFWKSESNLSTTKLEIKKLKAQQKQKKTLKDSLSASETERKTTKALEETWKKLKLVDFVNSESDFVFVRREIILRANC